MTEPYTAAERARQALIDDAARVAEAGLRKKRLEDAAEEMYEALLFYSNPQVYAPHPHGPAFDCRDLSFVARNALAKAEGRS